MWWCFYVFNYYSMKVFLWSCVRLLFQDAIALQIWFSLTTDIFSSWFRFLVIHNPIIVHIFLNRFKRLNWRSVALLISELLSYLIKLVSFFWSRNNSITHKAFIGFESLLTFEISTRRIIKQLFQLYNLIIHF